MSVVSGQEGGCQCGAIRYRLLRAPVALYACHCSDCQKQSSSALSKHVRLSRELGVPFEEWDAGKIREKLPIYDTRRYGPPRLMSDEGFGEPSGGELAGGVFWPTAGYISDPQLSTHNLQRAAEAKGSEFRFGREVVGDPQRRQTHPRGEARRRDGDHVPDRRQRPPAPTLQSSTAWPAHSTT